MGREAAVSRWQDEVTSLRVKHGVWVSIPALMYRVGLVKGADDVSTTVKKQKVI